MTLTTKVKERIRLSVGAGGAFFLALTYSDIFERIISMFVAEGNSLEGRIVFAIIGTVVVVLFVYLMEKILR